MMDPHEGDLYKDFNRDIIQHREDTRNDHWKYMCDKLVKTIGRHEINLLSPKDCISRAISVTKPDIIQALDDLENAFYCISQYAINLCRDQRRPEYSIIKTYTGYYASNISSVMNGGDSSIISSMGYVVKPDCENSDEFVLKKAAQEINQLAFQLFLAQPYCRLIKEMFQEATGKYPIEAIEHVINCDIGEILKFGVDNMCQHWVYKNMPNEAPSDNPGQYRTYQNIQANTEQFTDEELYGPKSMSTSEQETETERHHTSLTYRRANYRPPAQNSHFLDNPCYDNVKPVYGSGGGRLVRQTSANAVTYTDGHTNKVKNTPVEETVRGKEGPRLHGSTSQARSDISTPPHEKPMISYPPEFKPSTYVDD